MNQQYSHEEISNIFQWINEFNIISSFVFVILFSFNFCLSTELYFPINIRKVYFNNFFFNLKCQKKRKGLQKKR